ncbi:ring finger protein-like [Neopsephotus bourkii]|uniref:ring finger protein-like n=1 Tax=Neopsephotus bourkii TaxID=309878 RepID=UPI002AA53893|nr:ring finger protein-like [Neopsephotus bourkii]
MADPMEPAAGEEAEPGPQPVQAPGECCAEQQSETEGLGGPQDLAQLCREAPTATWGHWNSPPVQDATEPLLPRHAEPPAHTATLPAGHDPPAAASPILPHAESPASWRGSPSLESASSSILSLSIEEKQTSSDEAAAAEPCHMPAGGEDECPICTEPYDEQRHKPALLNCNHGLCRACLRTIMDTAASAEFGRVRCPICRQKTPMLEWEICKLQEELLLLHAQPGSPGALVSPRPPALPPRRPGLAGALEHRFHVRFHTSRMFGCLPCIRYPPCLIRALARLERRCRCCYLLLLVLLLVAEMLSLLLIFLPVLLMVLLFLILDK